ncbi:MAG: cysteine desulfurase [Candidatus Aenigmarchaeota archaeon]|nr:cysteine desulfurase [Candidatus Aenigmarchaeota archaeon]
MNIEKIKSDFPLLSRKVNGKQLVYLDSAATSQKPKQVISAITNYYENHNANVHRGVHKLSEEATEAYEGSRKKIADFVNAKANEMIFTRNATEGINLVAQSLGFRKGDEIVSSVMEHHSNIVPWQMLKSRGVTTRFADIDEDGILKMDDYENLITKKTKLIAVTHVSNVLGTINNVKKIAKIAHDAGALLLVDAAQSVPHMPVDVRNIEADFLVFSGHKMLGPTGIGCLYGRSELLDAMPPFMGGGDMIKDVKLEGTIYNDVPYKFEAGTPHIAGAVGLGAAVDYLVKIGMKNVHEHEKKLVNFATTELQITETYGNAPENGGIVAFNVHGLHSHDVASMLDENGIAVRSGHHCAQPLMKRLGIVSAARASFYVYNDEEDITKLSASLKDIINLLKRKKVV